MRAGIFGSQFVPIDTGWAAHDAALLVAGEGRGLFPRPIVGHRTLDGEYTAVLIGDDEVERLVGIVAGHGINSPRRSIERTATRVMKNTQSFLVGAEHRVDMGLEEHARGR